VCERGVYVFGVCGLSVCAGAFVLIWFYLFVCLCVCFCWVFVRLFWSV